MTGSDQGYVWDAIHPTLAPHVTSLLDMTSAMTFVQEYRERALARLRIHPTDQVLDIGCGLGDQTRLIAQLLGEGGLVIGVDKSEALLAEARRRLPEAAARIEFRVEDAHQLSFPARSFDVCRAERIFQHLERPAQALSELVRVARSGARLQAIDPDWEALLIDAQDQALTRKMVHFFCDQVRHSWMGRQLLGLFKKAGLVDIQVTPETQLVTKETSAYWLRTLVQLAQQAQAAGIVSAEQATRWRQEQEQANREGRLFVSTTLFVVSGSKL